MAIESHLEELIKKHRELDDLITKVQQSPGVDYLVLKGLKLRRLRLKDEIVRIEKKCLLNLEESVPDDTGQAEIIDLPEEAASCFGHMPALPLVFKSRCAA